MRFAVMPAVLLLVISAAPADTAKPDSIPAPAEASAPAAEAAASSVNPAAETRPERRVWRGKPIKVELKLGRERIIRMPDAGQLRAGTIGGPVPGLRIQPLGERLFLLATQPFAQIRMIVEDDNARQIVLDVTAAEDVAAGPPLEILTPPPPVDSASATPTPSPSPPPATGYVALIRHASQTLYAPERLIPRSQTIVPVPLPVTKPIPLVRGGEVRALPIAAWRSLGPEGPLWLTAVQLTNRISEPVELDPRRLRGRWRAAAFQHARLLPAGDPADTTAVYLISDRPFDQALAPWPAAAVMEPAQ
ncbi:MAG TPA: TIGR03749 family integrating conjugative element protein [Rhodobacteraceae bacterium]|nr:TIGR03749 family integrating conjugative element protein [Paracoccaceae bacterium]